MRLTQLTLPLALMLGATPLAAQGVAQQNADSAADPYLWLESQTGDRAMAWVRAENAKTLAVLEADPHFKPLYEDALRIAQASDRIAYPSFLAGAIYNFWQDSAHVRGIWRRTTLASYRTASPKWTTVLDLDSLAKAEKANWVWEGADCAQPRERRCLIALSDGGEDAVTVREFDLPTRRFVKHGFVLPRGKQNYTWMGEDTLLVGREWRPGELTKSGYPYIIRRVVRGQPLDRATEVFRGTPDDVSAGAYTLHDAQGHRAVLLDRGVSFFESQKYLLTRDGAKQLALPLKAGVSGLLEGQLLVRLSQDWNEGDAHIGAGSIASFGLAGAMKDQQHLHPVAVFTPGPRESVGGFGLTRDRIIASIYQNVRGHVFTFTRSTDGSWSPLTLPFPDNLTTSIVDADLHGNDAFVSVAGFLTPSSVWLADAKSGAADVVKTLAPKFDASRDTVEQREAASSDGTMIPYFIVHPKGMPLDGSNPTIINAYGGFEASETPFYSANIGKMWLEHGGVFVLANIRGGGEFGPKWHEAGLKTKRQIIYDDFASVAKDLIARNVTSPRRLGIMGGSNGGLLMGVEFTQHPEMWNAVDIQVPLLDMMRYEQIDAGASWVGEYGSVSNPDERAFLASISPYQNLKRDVKYPEPFIWSTTKDDRVGPQHARKFAARMAEYGLPYLFYEVTEGGHGSGANLKERAHTNALEYTYFARKLME